MLVELSVKDFVLIGQATLAPDRRLTVVSGATGDGKTLLLRALRFLLGDRAVPDRTVRAGSERALVEGLFRIEGAELRAELRERGAPEDWDEPELVLSRSLERDGRNRARIGGRLATVAQLRSVGGRLVDFLSQHEYQSLASPERQRQVLDAIRFRGGLTVGRKSVPLSDLRRRFTAERDELLAAARSRDALLAESEGVRQRDARLQEELEALRALAPATGELEALERSRERLANVDAIRRALEGGHDRLAEREGAAIDLIRTTARELEPLAGCSDAIARLHASLAAAAAEVASAATELARERDRLDADPRELESVEDRIDAFRSLARRFSRPGEPPVDPGSLAARLAALEGSVGRESGEPIEAQLASRDRELREKASLLDALGDELSRGRRAAARALEAAVLETLRELALETARLSVTVTALARAPRLSLEQQPQAPGTITGSGPASAAVEARFPAVSGLDAVLLRFAASASGPLLPLAAVASGGELARVSLALKRVLAEADDVPVLVFDEVDQNTGGRLGAAVGSTLASIAASRQVIAVTHLPSVAAYADRHVLVEKRSERGKDLTSTRELEQAERLRELALMIKGEPVTEVALEQARELLALALARRSPGRKRGARARGKSLRRTETVRFQHPLSR